MDTHDFEALGKEVREFTGQLDVIPTKTAHLRSVSLVSDEVTALCPVTGQPDYYEVAINFTPIGRIIESKSLKLYLGSFRDKGIFAEEFAERIAVDVYTALDQGDPGLVVTCVTRQKARGGIVIETRAVIGD